MDEAWKTRRRWGGGRTRVGAGVLAARANGSVAGLAGSVFHGLSTGAIPQTQCSGGGQAVGNAGPDRGEQRGVHGEHRSDLYRLIRNIASFDSAGRRRLRGGRGDIGKEHSPFQSGRTSAEAADGNIARFNRGVELRFPPFAHRTSGSTGDRHRGRSVENAPALGRGSNAGRSRITRSRGERLGGGPGRERFPRAVHGRDPPEQYSGGGQAVGNAGPDRREAAPARDETQVRPVPPGLSRLKSGTSPVSNSAGLPAVCDGEGGRRKEHRPIRLEAELRFPPFAHRASGLSGDRRHGRSVENARPPVFPSRSGGEKDGRGTRHRAEHRPFHWPRRLRRTAPILLTCTVADSVQDDHAHFVVEADDKLSLANGMKSLGARFARCVNRVYERAGRVLATRFHHVVKRTPTEVRNALAYVLLNARKHYRERRRTAWRRFEWSFSLRENS